MEHSFNGIGIDNLDSDEIKIEKVISEFVNLKERGTIFIGLCPFHKELTPSFSVSSSRQIFKCFGCGKGGNVIAFIMEFYRLSHSDAVKWLNDKYTNRQVRSSSVLSTLPGSEVTNQIVLNLDSNLKLVEDLMLFDDTVISFCIQMVEALDERIRNNREISITNVLFFPTSTIQGLKNIKSNKSLSHKYGMIYNQCVVLLVSYFTSSVKEFFRATYKLMANGDSELFRGVHTELKLTVEELSENRFNLADIIGDLVVKKNGISFQDMKSIVREFEHNFGICICKDEHLDNIIVLQAARHAIVHSMSVADDKFINQIRSTKQRSLKSQINLNDEILFTVEEINIAIQSMKLFFTDLNNSILKRLNNLS